jgi:MIP family channel proteins
LRKSIDENNFVMKVQLAWIIGINTALLSDAFSLYPKTTSEGLIEERRFKTSQSWKESPLSAEKGNTFILEDAANLLELRGGGEVSSSTSSKHLFREMLAELLGTFLIVFIGTGSVSSAVFTESLVGLFQIASVWIIAVTIAICTTASISGAHLNPAISIAFAMFRPSKSFNWKKVLPYSFSQCLGAIFGGWLNFVIYGSSISAFEGKRGIIRSSASGIASAKCFGEYFLSPVTTMTAFMAECIGTGILAFVIFSLTHPNNDTVENGFIPPLIGLTVGGLIAVFAPLTQAGFNPARDFGPRIVAWFAGWKTVAFTNAWLYIVAPIIGALGGAALADRVLFADFDTER